MKSVDYQEVIITCEACKTVRKFPVSDYDQCLDIFHQYQCPNGCGRNLYSFFSVGRLTKKSEI